jgi:hypothetical protein
MAIAPREAALVAQSKETPAFREFVRERWLHSNLEQHARSKVRLQLSPRPEARGRPIGMARSRLRHSAKEIGRAESRIGSRGAGEAFGCVLVTAFADRSFPKSHVRFESEGIIGAELKSPACENRRGRVPISDRMRMSAQIQRGCAAGVQSNAPAEGFQRLSAILGEKDHGESSDRRRCRVIARRGGAGVLKRPLPFSDS